MRIYDIRINHIREPIGFAMKRVSISWKVADAKGKRQTAVRICVSSDFQMKEILWDSGYDNKLSSLGSIIPISLSPRQRYYIQVIVHSEKKEETSAISFFETGKMDEKWQGKWISCQHMDRHPIFKKEIHLRAPLKSARLYLCGLGLYEAYYENEKLGDEYLAPFSNNYNRWLQVQTLDISHVLKKKGILSILLGNGWYKGRFGFTARNLEGFYGDNWLLIAELHLNYKDGSEEIIGSDESWSIERSNIFFSSIYDGEQIDDTLPPLPIERASLSVPPKGKLSDRLSPYLCAHERLSPISVITSPKGETILDMGQEITGFFSLKVDLPAGQQIRIQTGELLQNGCFYRDNLRSAKSEFIYVSDGQKKTIRPHFTYYGYRYVLLEGFSHFELSHFQAVCLYSDVSERSSLKTGHALVNQLISNVLWGLKDNFVDVPTDCPQRDERMGWTADTQVFTPTASYLTDSYAFYAKYLYDMFQEQSELEGMVPDVIPSAGIISTSSVWGDASCIIPWTLYEFYGDQSILEDQYDSMKAWVSWIERYDGDDLSWRKHFTYGDWLALDDMSDDPQHAMGATDSGYISSIYYAASSEILGKTAALLGKEEDSQYYLALAKQQFDAVRRDYFSASGRCCVNTQTALLLALKYHLSSDEDLTRKMLFQLFTKTDHQLRTGFTGTPLLGNILTEHGFTDLAFELLLYEGFPGWLREVKLGATTVWERWNSLLDDGSISGTDMNSLNHYAYGSIVEWIYRHVAGFQQCTGSVGFCRAKLAPLVHWDLREVSAQYDSASGLYQVHWKILDERHLQLSFDIPFQAQAFIKLPCFDPTHCSDSNNPLLQNPQPEGYFVEAGHYEICYESCQSLLPTHTVDLPVLRLSKNDKAIDLMTQYMPHKNVPVEMRGGSFRDLLDKYQPNLSEDQISIINEKLNACYHSTRLAEGDL